MNFAKATKQQLLCILHFEETGIAFKARAYIEIERRKSI